jgi:predicted phage terminase large subunit-like protein
MFPQSRRKIIEGKANGDAVIDSLKHEIPGIVVFEPGRDSKEGRATAVSPYIRAGNVHLPTTRVASMAPEISFDVEAFILEATAFPSGAHNDQIDAASQYLIETYLVGGQATFSVPTGVIPLSAARRQRQQALPVQQRLTAGGQSSHWGQALSPFQQRLTDRQLRR